MLSTQDPQSEGTWDPSPSTLHSSPKAQGIRKCADALWLQKKGGEHSFPRLDISSPFRRKSCPW